MKNLKNPSYDRFVRSIRHTIPPEQIYTDELRRLAWGTDAGFYRLIPQVVVRSRDESDIQTILHAASECGVAVTFRAAGTSLSGQAISDSVLVVAGKHWEHYHLSDDRQRVTLQPGLTGARVNQLLAPYGRRFAPDPASVNSAMVGGIVMNNASGMSCGTHANSDRELIGARIVLTDGTLLDTNNPQSRRDFMATHASMIRQIEQLRDDVRADRELVDRIRYKYSIKNVTGLNLRPLVDYDDPFDMIAHLLVGSEGTLAFLSEVTMKTEPILPYRASAMIYFDGIRRAAEAVVAMRQLDVSAAELLDPKSLASVDDPAGEGLTAVLTQTEADSPERLRAQIAAIEQALVPYPTARPFCFTDDPTQYAKFWAIRAGIFPAVGGTRAEGTTCMIEDVAFHIEDLPAATADLAALLEQHGYHDACIYGHALEGNFHFIVNQSLDTPEQIERYRRLIDDVVHMVADKYDGSLKAEHGTGRNMAPFVRYEWGDKAFALMQRIKKLFDPQGVLNPGVIFNDDEKCYLKNFKPLPVMRPRDANAQHSEVVYEALNRCIECGFCEVNCLSCGLGLSSRTRIVLQRELSRLRASGDNPRLLRRLERQYRYPGNQMCAGDGLCSTSCPMGINVADLTHELRREALPPTSMGYRVGHYVADHFGGVKEVVRVGLTAADTLRRGLPLWTPSMPKAYRVHKLSGAAQVRKVVYFPSCINQTMGLPAQADSQRHPLVEETVALLNKAGYEVIFPERMEQLCCGTIWESKGMVEIADRKTAELDEALWNASEQGRYPILCDQSPCLHRMRQHIHRMQLYEPVSFIQTFLLDRLSFTPIDRPVVVHITCSMRLMGLGDRLIDLAQRCSTHVLVPDEVGCCGFAGDKGFTHPEVNAYALRKLRPQAEAYGALTGYSNSRTCEIGLATHAGIPYLSIVYLVNECTHPKTD